MNKIVISLLTSMTVYCVQASAFTCFITLVKDSCWTDYDVSVNVIDAASGKSMLNVSVPKGQSWVRQQFTCQESQVLNYSAVYSPIFWQADKGKHYPGLRTWYLPSSIATGDTAWNLNVCYPADFAEVPLPPTAGNNCHCNTQDIPPVVAPGKAS